MAAAKAAAVKVQFKAVGGAPIMKKNAFKISGGENFQKVRQEGQGSPWLSLQLPHHAARRSPPSSAKC